MKTIAVALLATAGLLIAAPSASADDTPCGEPICIAGGPPATPNPAPADVVTPDPTNVPAPHLGPFPAMKGTDHRPCVSQREYRGAKRLTKAETEARWEVIGMGRLREITGLGNAWVYPRCGYDLGEAWYAAVCERGMVTMVAEWRETGAVPDALI